MTDGLNAIVLAYRRAIARRAQTGGDVNYELEVRLANMTPADFETIHRGLGLEGATLEQTVNAIVDKMRPAETAEFWLRPSYIRTIAFQDGVKTGQHYVKKANLQRPHLVPGLYNVALASEEPAAATTLDERAHIRVKARVVRPPVAGWRVDTTIVYQIPGAAAEGTKAMVDALFRATPPMTPANFLDARFMAAPGVPPPHLEVELEYVGGADEVLRPESVTAAVGRVLGLVNPDWERDLRYQEEVKRVAAWLSPAGAPRAAATLKRLLPPAVALTAGDYADIYRPVGYHVTDKADGKRAVALAAAGSGVVIADVLHTFAAERGVNGERRPGAPPETARGTDTHAAGAGGAPETVVDGEWVGDRFYGFDVIASAGASLAAAPFARRLDALAPAIEALRAAGVPAEAKGYRHITSETPAELEALFRSVYEAKRPYAVDGLILVEPGQPYADTTAYKWKSREHNTIDFLARRAPATALAELGVATARAHTVYFLFVGISSTMFEAFGLRHCPGYADLFPRTDSAAAGAAYLPVQFSPSTAPHAYVCAVADAAAAALGTPDLDGHIVEARLAVGGEAWVGGGATPARAAKGKSTNKTKSETNTNSGPQLLPWEVIRVREDRRRELAAGRYYGNDFRVAESVFLNYLDPFPIEYLWNGPSESYFAYARTSAYRAQTDLVSFMKTLRISALHGAAYVVDLGAGRGADIGRYLDAEVRTVVAVDNDRRALAELIQRRYGHTTRRLKEKKHGATTVHVVIADVTSAHDALADRLRRRASVEGAFADAIVCNFAVHYFLGSVEGLRNLAALAQDLIRIGGSLTITALMGEAVHAKLHDVPFGETWALRDGTDAAAPTKYAITRHYHSETLEPAGQKVAVKLPFRDEPSDEYLVNVGALTSELELRGFKKKSETLATALIPEFETRRRARMGRGPKTGDGVPADAPGNTLLTPADREYVALIGEVVWIRVE